MLTWIAGARPPAHPNEMEGRQVFQSAYDAGVFFSKQEPDTKFVSLIIREIQETDLSYIFERDENGKISS